MAGKPAARLGDQTAHGGVITGPGEATVLIEGKPACVMGDQHTCPMVNPTPAANPHVGGPIMATGATVLIGGKPAARLGDTAICQGPPATIIIGSMTVLIGDGGGAGGGGAGTSKSGTAKAKARAEQVEEGHYLDVKFVDKGGKPVSGAKYTVKGSGKQFDGNLLGRVKRTGLKEGTYKIALKTILKAEWSTDKAKAGETVKLAAETAGIDDGEQAVFRIHIRDINYADRELTTVEGEVSGNKAEVDWQLEVDESLLDIQADKEKVGRFSAPVYYFIAETGGFSRRSPFLSIVDDMEVRIVDDEGNPIRDKTYRLYLANGEVREGTLDGDGKATLEDIPPGSIRIAVDVRE